MATKPDDRDGKSVREPTPEEQAVFTQLFKEHFMSLFWYVRGFVPMEEDARDIAHEVFYRIWTRDIVVDPNRPARPYLCKVAQRAAYDYLRHERIENRFVDQCLQAAELDGPPLAPDDSERDIVNREQLEAVTRAIDALSSRQREVLLMRLRDQLCRAEIARRLNISIKTVAIHLERAREQLRKTLPGMRDLE